MMRVRVVIAPVNETWVIGKLAKRLVESLAEAGVEATLGPDPDDGADINHWMSYAIVSRRSGRASTMFISHLDDPYQTAHVSRSLREYVDLGLCMSRDMMRALSHWGAPADRLWYVLPAHDVPSEPARIRIAIATRLYGDGRKREAFLVRLASERDLSPFHFEIAGLGWDDVIPQLRAAGATVNWRQANADYRIEYEAVLEGMRTCEWYLYLGMDEGSLGVLDALALGLKTITTEQGFHLDITGGIQEPVNSYEQLQAVFDRLAGERERRLASVRNWTWAQYARDHLLVWEALLRGKRSELAAFLKGQGRFGEPAKAPSAEGLSRRTWSGYYARAFSPARVLKALASVRALRPLRRFLRR